VEEHRLIVSEAASGSLQNVTGPIVNDTVVYQNSNVDYNPTKNSTEWDWLPSRETCIYVYSGLVASVVLLSVCSVICFFAVCMRASIHLHNAMFSGITRATMWFFNNNPSGNLNDTGLELHARTSIPF
jgi:ATP-binding cassette subfamily C (CFTR/MRP) protein 4